MLRYGWRDEGRTHDGARDASIDAVATHAARDEIRTETAFLDPGFTTLRGDTTWGWLLPIPASAGRSRMTSHLILCTYACTAQPSCTEAGTATQSCTAGPIDCEPGVPAINRPMPSSWSRTQRSRALRAKCFATSITPTSYTRRRTRAG